MEILGAVLERSGNPAPFAASRPFTVGPLDLDEPGPGELLVRIEAAGVCHSDLSVVDGNRVRPTPMLLGPRGRRHRRARSGRASTTWPRATAS